MTLTQHRAALARYVGGTAHFARRRTSAVRDAYAAGLSVTTIAGILGVSHMWAFRLVHGDQRRKTTAQPRGNTGE